MQSRFDLGSNWVYKVCKDPNVKPKQLVIDTAKKAGDKLIIDRQVPFNRWFGAYKTDDDLIANIKRGNYNLYEVIYDTLCKLYLDVEFTPKQGDAKTIHKIVNDLVEYINNALGVPCKLEDIVISQSIGVGEGNYKGIIKYSYHVVVNNGFYIHDNRKIKALLAPFLNKWVGMVDHLVYGKNQSFKMPYQSKLDSARVQTIVNGEFKDHLVTNVCDNPQLYQVQEVIERIPIEQREIVIQPREYVYVDDNINLYSAESILEHLPNDDEIECDWDYYSRVAMCCKNEGVAYSHFDEWAKKHPSYDANKNKAYYDRIPVKVDGGMGVGTLRHLIKRFYPKICTDARRKQIAQCTAPTIDFKKHGIHYKEYESRYLKPFDEEFDYHKHIIIKSHLGTGKTTQIRRTIERLMPRSILVISPRVMFARSMYGAIKKICPQLVMYQDILVSKNNPTARHEYPYIVCQLESLHTLKDQYDMVIVDESESILAQFSSSTMRENIVDIYKKFETIIANASYTIWSDAFITDRTIMTCKRLNKKDKQLTFGGINEDGFYYTQDLMYINNTFQPYIRKAIQVGNTNDKFISFIEDYVRKYPTRRLVIVSSSKATSNKLKSILKNALVINSETDDNIKKQMEDVNELWSQYQYVVYTSSITVGVNYDHENQFDDLFMSFSACACSPRDNMQSSLRARHINSNTLYYSAYSNYSIREKVHFEVFDRNELWAILSERCNWITKNNTHDHDALPEWMKHLWVYNTQENNVSAYMHGDMVKTYLNICGYVDNETYKNEIKKMEIDDGALNYDEIEDVDDMEFSTLMDKFKAGSATYEEKRIIKKHYFQRCVIRMDNVEPIVAAGLFQRWVRDTAEIENKIRHTKFEKYGIVNKEDATSVFIENVEQKLEAVKDVCKVIGIDKSYELGKQIEKAMLEKNVENILAMKKELVRVFGLRQRGDNKVSGLRAALDLLNQVFVAWGFTEIVKGKRKAKKIDGKVIDVSDYVVAPLEGKQKLWSAEFLAHARDLNEEYVGCVGDEEEQDVF
jgi:hypothetical protein